MKIWKALLLVSFLFYAAHCEEEKAQEAVKDAVADEKVEDAPQEQEAAFEDEQEDSADEESDEENLKEDETEEVEVQDEENDASHYKPILISTKKIYLYKNKNVGQCLSTSKTIRCFTRKQCVKRHYYYKNQCIKYQVKKWCVIQTTTTCKFCSKWFWRRCYKVRHGYKYIIKCYNSRPSVSCVRRVTSRVNKTVLVKTYYVYSKHHNKNHH